MWLRFKVSDKLVRWFNLGQLSEVYIYLDERDPHISLYGDSDDPIVTISKRPTDVLSVFSDRDALSQMREDIESVPLYAPPEEPREKWAVEEISEFEGPAG
jgi:hypothetical protein